MEKCSKQPLRTQANFIILHMNYVSTFPPAPTYLIDREGNFLIDREGNYLVTYRSRREE